MTETNGRGAAIAAAFSMVVAQVAPVSLPIGMSAASAQQYGTRSRNVTCYSSNNREKRCDLPRNTQSVSYVGPDRSMRCREGQTWWRQGDQIVVTGGCGGNFEALYYDGNSGGGGYPGQGNSDRGFAGEIECGSWNNNRQRCSARTQNRVELVQRNGGSCVHGRDWTYTGSRIEVRNGCRARFAYGYGNYNPGWNNNDPNYRPPRDEGSNTGAIIGGVALAAGLVALLAAAGKKNSGSGSSNNSSATGAARISADYGKFPSDARAEGEACMQEAARQVGSTGGTQVTLSRVDRAERTSSGWTLVAQLSGTYDGKGHTMTMDCRANGSKVSAFEVR